MTSSSDRQPTAGRDAGTRSRRGDEPAAAAPVERDPAARTRRIDEPRAAASFAERVAADAAQRGRSPFTTAAAEGERAQARPVPGAGGHYARFIPREEVRSFAAWTPGSFGGTATQGEPAPGDAPPAAPPMPAELAAQLQAARQSGYQDGYRDGLVALDAFKQSYAQQITAQMGTLAEAWRSQLDQLDRSLASQVAEVALALARQVVRSELATKPEFVAAVVQEALAATLSAAQQVAVHLHPDDHALVQAHAGEAIASRGARLVPDAALARGGCVIETDLGVIDASIETRWRRAAAAMGRPGEFGSDAQDEVPAS